MTESPDFQNTPNRDKVLISVPQIEAMCRLLIDSGDMTPMAKMQLRKLWRHDG